MQYLISGSLVVYWPRAVCILIIDCDFYSRFKIISKLDNDQAFTSALCLCWLFIPLLQDWLNFWGIGTVCCYPPAIIVNPCWAWSGNTPKPKECVKLRLCNIQLPFGCHKMHRNLWDPKQSLPWVLMQIVLNFIIIGMEQWMVAGTCWSQGTCWSGSDVLYQRLPCDFLKTC